MSLKTPPATAVLSEVLGHFGIGEVKALSDLRGPISAPWKVQRVEGSDSLAEIVRADGSFSDESYIITRKNEMAESYIKAAGPDMYIALKAVIEAAGESFRDVWRNGDHDTQHFCALCGEQVGHDETCP